MDRARIDSICSGAGVVIALGLTRAFEFSLFGSGLLAAILAGAIGALIGGTFGEIIYRLNIALRLVEILNFAVLFIMSYALSYVVIFIITTAATSENEQAMNTVPPTLSVLPAFYFLIRGIKKYKKKKAAYEASQIEH